MKIIDYFLPTHVVKRCTENLSEIEAIKWESKTRFQISINLIFIITLTFLTLVRFITNSELDDRTLYLLPAMILFIAGSLIYIRTHGNVNINSFIIVCCALIILPIRTYTTGGFLAPNLSWYFAIFLLMTVLFSVRTSVISYLYLVAIFIFFHTYEIPSFTMPLSTRLSVHLSAYLVFTIIYFSFVKSSKKLQSFVVGLEREKLLNSTTATISHEINNPLTIALFKLRKLQIPEEDKKTKELIEKQLQEIKQTVTKINESNLKAEATENL